MKGFEETHGSANVHFIKYNHTIHLFNTKFIFNRCDVTKEEELEALYNGAEEYFGGKVSIFCNNAGINHMSGWKKCMDIDIVRHMLNF